MIEAKIHSEKLVKSWPKYLSVRPEIKDIVYSTCGSYKGVITEIGHSTLNRNGQQYPYLLVLVEVVS